MRLSEVASPETLSGALADWLIGF
ncbi:MAG: hypothetical protein QOI18_1735, partial [Solirubrobacteraceae bacterium]|nr:hypothetical protein [Solirubrobacteraceae bacterium]